MSTTKAQRKPKDSKSDRIRVHVTLSERLYNAACSYAISHGMFPGGVIDRSLSAFLDTPTKTNIQKGNE